jgi:hypothetical protein
LYFRKFEVILPVFFGCLGSLVLSVRLADHWPDPPNSHADEVRVSEAEVQIEAEVQEKPITVKTESIHQFARKAPERKDIMLEMYRQPELRDRIIEFFEKICESREIAEVILAGADRYDIAPALAVALAWEESRLNPRAVNSANRDDSIDRGLFQLNNRSFPRLEIHAFFNLELNAHYGLSHLRHCLDTGGTEIAALAMYNAGTVRVHSSGTPKTTLDYISRILENRGKIESRFHELEIQFQEDPLEAFAEPFAEAEPEERPRLLSLMPLTSK